MATPLKHWLHKTPTELLDAGGSRGEAPLETLHILLLIKTQQDIYVVQGGDGRWGVPMLPIGRGQQDSSRPISELVLAMLRPVAPYASNWLRAPQFIEFGFANPIVFSIERRLDIAVMISPEFVDIRWKLPNFNGKGWWNLSAPGIATAFSGRVVHRLQNMNAQRGML